MNGGFTRGLIVGSLIGTSIGMMMPDMKHSKARKRMMRNGRNMLRKSGNIISDMVDVFR